MSVIGLRVGPFEIAESADVPEPGDWFVARRAGLKRRPPTEVLVRIPRDPSDATDQRRVQRQLDALRAVEDERLPAPVAFYEGTGALAVSFARGVPLMRLVEERAAGTLPLTPATLLDLVVDLAEVLQHAHHNGQVHGHLWPGNVWLSGEGKLRVWGLGLPDEAPLAWRAPEAARGHSATTATDQWSLGVLIVGLIAGGGVWDDDSAARKGDATSFVDVAERQWPALGRLVRRMCDPHAANRYPSLHPVRQELLALSRKASGVSDRRRLGAALAAILSEAPVEEPEVVQVEPEQPARATRATAVHQEPPQRARPKPARPAPAAMVEIEDEDFPSIAVAPRGHEPREHLATPRRVPVSEDLHTVQPDVANYGRVPTARLDSTPAPLSVRPSLGRPAVAIPTPEITRVVPSDAGVTELVDATEMAATELITPDAPEPEAEPAVHHGPPPIRTAASQAPPSTLRPTHRPSTVPVEVELELDEEDLGPLELIDDERVLAMSPFDPPTSPNPDVFGRGVKSTIVPSAPPPAVDDDPPSHPTAVPEDCPPGLTSVELSPVNTFDDDFVGAPLLDEPMQVIPERPLADDPSPEPRPFVVRATPWFAAASMSLLALYTVINVL